MKRGCVMIARSDRPVPHTDEGLGVKVHFFAPAALRFDSPDEGPAKANRWGDKAEPPAFCIPRRLCREPVRAREQNTPDPITKVI